MERKVKYSYEFKLRCVNEVLYQHKSVNSVSKSNGVDHKSVDLWLSFYQKYGKLGLLPRKNKTYSVESVSENNASSGGTYQILTAGYWGNTSAITVVTLAMLFGSNYVQYSSASLYGIKNS